ncbi:archaeosortase A [Halobaculum sp. D14]|uniref:archaeosortase A n=1 Tax=Halobaculum sp. D14 TaxID=3421642 RepID=UPI003EBE4B5D
MPSVLTDLFAWLVIAAFLVGASFEWLQRRSAAGLRQSGRGWLAALSDRLSSAGVDPARATTAAAWALFAAFWLVLFPHFAFTQKSYVEGVLALAAVPACLYAGWLLWNGRDSLFVLSRAVAAMGLVYLPFETIPSFTVAGVHVPAPKRVLILTVTEQTGFVIRLLGYHPERVEGPVLGYMNAYQFTTAGGHKLLFEILLACTGLGSMAIFVGLIAAVRAPLARKLRALAVSIPVIWALNLVRTTFIGVTFGNQYLQVFVDEVLFLFGSDNVYKVSYFVADRILSQVLAVVALVGITYLVVRELPELLTVVEDVLYLLTNEEYDLRSQVDPAHDAAADSGSQRL